MRVECRDGIPIVVNIDLLNDGDGLNNLCDGSGFLLRCLSVVQTAMLMFMLMKVIVIVLSMSYVVLCQKE